MQDTLFIISCLYTSSETFKILFKTSATPLTSITHVHPPGLTVKIKHVLNALHVPRLIYKTAHERGLYLPDIEANYTKRAFTEMRLVLQCILVMTLSDVATKALYIKD